MSQADNCYDNAFMESCWGTLKRELEATESESVAAARTVVAEYVRYYRFERKHSSLGTSRRTSSPASPSPVRKHSDCP